MNDRQETLAEYVLGALAPEARASFERELASLPDLAREAAALTEALVAGLARSLPMPEPPAGARARLLGTLAAPDRFAPFVDLFARICDLSREAAQAIIARIDDLASWEKGLPGMLYLDFNGGAKLGTASAGLVRLEAGMAFPRHRHLGPETTLVLEGAMREGGRVHGPGSVVEATIDTEHDYAASEAGSLTLLIVHGGIMPVF